MATTTRSMNAAILKHIFENVLLEPSDGHLAKSLTHHGYDTVWEILEMTKEDIDMLTMESLDPNETKRVPLLRGKCGLIHVLQAFVWYLHNEKLFVTYTALTSTELNDFRLSHYDPNAPLPPPVFTPRVTTVRSTVDDFRKSIKRDKSHYAPFKDDKQWDNWRRSTMATARSHGCEDIFDPNYHPSNQDDLAIFAEKQKFIYSVFEEKLQTDMGKYFVRQHEHDYDAQAIYSKLLAHARASTQASIDTADLLSYITTTKLHDSKWCGTAHSFILHWCDKVRTYEDLVDTPDHFTGNLKMTMLQNAVSGISELHQVKVQSSHDVAHGSPPLSFEQYKTLLLSAASTYDARRGLTRARPTRIVNDTEVHPSLVPFSANIHDSTNPDPDASNDSAPFHDIDTDFATLELYESRRAPNRRPPFQPRMPRDKWQSLTPEEQQHWDMPSPAAKATILGIGKSPPPRIPRQLDLHDISAADYLHIVATHQSHPSPAPTPTASSLSSEESPADDTATPAALLACAAKTAPPGDLRRVLGSRKPPASLPSSDEITINGKTYRCISVHERISYAVSNHKAACHGSLVDRGANGGLAGSDVRIISKDPHPRLVDVSGIDSHQITNLPIVTVGGVVPSQRGPVIAIMHQYAYMGNGKTIHSSGQLEWYKNDVNDKSLHISGGLQ